MATEVIMPKVDMVMDTGTFVEWLKREGDRVEKGEPLFVVLTDKANIEVEAPASGVLAGLSAQPDDVIPVAQIIAYILEPGESLPAGAEGEPVTAAMAQVVSGGPRSTVAEAVPPRPSDGKLRATPAARRLAAELGVDLALVAGRGPRNRIHKADVLAAAERPPPAAPQPTEAFPALQVPLPSARRRAVVPLTGPRRIIAKRMAHSASTAPHITLSLRADMTESIRLRTQLLEPLEQRTGYRLSLTAIVARVVAAVLPSHAYLNASVNGDEIILWDDVHLGIATSLDDYLIVPVIREAQAKSLEQIVVELNGLLERARAKRLTPAEMSGSTFTLSNLGMFGVESFTAIINPPEVAILAVGKMVDTPVHVEGEAELRPMMNLSLSADHRVVDGVTGARFLSELKANLENPYLLI